MKRLFLTSNAGNVAREIAKELLPEKKKLLFVKTASEVYGENPEWLQSDRNKLQLAGFDVFDFTITGKSAIEIKKELNRCDVIFVSGGNSYYLLEKIQQSDCIEVFRDAVENGMPYIGSSAGSVIAGSNIKPVGTLDDMVKAPYLKGFSALGLVDFVVYPHWGYEKYVDKSVENLKESYIDDYKIILLTDYQYVKVEGEMYRIEEVAHTP